MPVKQDVGMKIKMDIKCFKDINLLDQGFSIDEKQIEELVDFVNNRYDCADFRLICLIKTYLQYYHLLSETIVEKIKGAILDFKYWMDEAGYDGMCYWSENHQILFASCEFLAGQTFPDLIFSNTHKLGVYHYEKAKTKILRWLKYRYQYGFTEWHSNTYYEEDIAPLSVLVDHASDQEIVQKSKIILDLLFLDMALHSFEGFFVATSGRCYEMQKKDSRLADVNDILSYAFNIQKREFNYQRISSMYLLCKNYIIPEVIVEIAKQKGELEIKDSMGLDLSEVDKELKNNDINDKGMFLWAMEAFTNKESINMTMDIFNKWNLKDNNFLKDLDSVNFPILRKLNLLPLIVRILNPATQGVAIQRCNTYTYRNDYYMLSSAQKYHPQEFGDQQHIWQATLQNQTNIFSTHPGSPMFDDAARNFSPSYWVGNGINPHAVQNKNVLLLMYDLRVRKGYLERERQNFVHFFFPISKFDQVIKENKIIFGKVNQSYIAIVSSLPYQIKGEEELIYTGRVSHFAVILGGESDGEFSDFVEKVRNTQFYTTNKSMKFVYDRSYVLNFKRSFYIDGKKISTDYSRFETPFVNAKRKPEVYEITCNRKKLILNFDMLMRSTEGEE